MFKKFINSHYFAFTVIACIFLIIYLSKTLDKQVLPDYFEQDFVNGKITEVMHEELESDPALPIRKNGKQEVKIEVLQGEYKGQIFESTNLLSRNHNVLVKEGMKVVVGIRKDGDKPIAWVYNYKREITLYVILGVFLVLMILLGRGQGAKAALSLVFAGVMLIYVLVPLLFRGYSPVSISILAMSATIIVSFLLISGWGRKTAAAIIGTIGGITVAGIISHIAGTVTHLSGIDLEHGEQLAYFAQDMNLNIKGLMFATILIASTGAVMDVAMSIASSIFEIKRTSPQLEMPALFKSGMRIGKDVMGTMSNTLILAFAGSSLPLMMLIYGYKLQYLQFINLQSISTEFIQGIAGSIGIILSVPITAAVASVLASKQAEKNTVKESKAKRHIS